MPAASWSISHWFLLCLSNNLVGRVVLSEAHAREEQRASPLISIWYHTQMQCACTEAVRRIFLWRFVWHPPLAVEARLSVITS